VAGLIPHVAAHLDLARDRPVLESLHNHHLLELGVAVPCSRSPRPPYRTSPLSDPSQTCHGPYCRFCCM
jgi:hypothetical protein